MTAAPPSGQPDPRKTIWFIAAFSSLIVELQDLQGNRGDGPGKRLSRDEVWNLIHQLAVSSEYFGFSDVAKSAREICRLVRASEPGDDLGGHIRKLCRMLESWRQAHTGTGTPALQRLGGDDLSDPRLVHLLCADPHRVDAVARQLRAGGWNVAVMTSRALLEMSMVTALPAAIIVHGGTPAAVDVVRAVRERLDNSVRLVYLADHGELALQFAALHAGASACLPASLGSAELVGRFYDLMGIIHHETARVLVVCDDEARARDYQRLLGAGGCECQVVSEPQQVMEPLIEFQPELVLVDLHQSDVDGQDFGAVVRQLAPAVRLPFVYVDASGGIDKRLATLGEGSDDYIAHEQSSELLPALVHARIVHARRLATLFAEDPLTGLLDRVAFERQFEYTLGMLTRSGGVLAVAMLDVDQLARINDTHGYATGDAILRHIAAVLTKRLRFSDSICRYAGGRIAIALPGADIDHAMMVINEARSRLEASPIDIDGNDVFFRTTAGVAAYRFKPSYGEIPLYAAQLIDSAGRALAAAKQQGGRCTVADPGG